MAHSRIARALFGALFGIFAACAGKSHVDIDILGDAARPNPLGGLTCAPSCEGNSICLLDQCVPQCQSDGECPAGNRCLRTTQGGGCVRSVQTDCSTCSLGGTLCISNECRTQCSFGCASDQFCRDVACYGSDTAHDPRGGTVTSGAGGSTGAGGGGVGGSTGNQCGALSDPCSRCMCNSCPSNWQACAVDLGCAAIADCARRTGCKTNCYQPAFCQGVIDVNGGPSGQSYAKESSLASCSVGPCQTSCSQGGLPDAGVPPAAGWWHFDEGFGTVTADASGNGHQGMLMNFPPWRSGITGSAIGLDGSSQYVFVATGSIIGTIPNFTVEAWVNWSGIPALQAIYCEAGFTDNIDLYLDAGTPILATNNNPSGSVRSSMTILPGWHHVAGVLQAGVGASIYVDGQIASSNPTTGPAIQAASETDIGRVSAAGGSRYFNGTIDEVRVFTIARSSQEIMADYMSSLTGGIP